MEKPIYERLKQINEKNIYPFHMPGHKRNKKFLEQIKSFIDLDFTEIDETDNMHKPEHIIKKSKQNIAKLFGADESYFLVNGSSGGIMASLMCALKPNENVLIYKNCHISVFNALILCGANPIYIEPKIAYNFAVGIDYDLIEKAINENEIKACIITSPTYEGIAFNIEKISKILHKKGIILILDEAHGAHFNFSEDFPKPALKQGADIVIQSFHKTLPTLTQCAMLHLKSDIVDKNLLEKCLSIIQTTSPSYVFMLNVENCCNYFKNYPHLFEDYVKKLKNIRKIFENLKNLKLLTYDLENGINVENLDISRFTFIIKKNVNGKFINDVFLKEKIQLEMYGEEHIIAISTVCDTDYGLDLFLRAVKNVDNFLNNFEDRKVKEYYLDKNITKPKYNLREIFYSQKEEVFLDRAENRILVDFITPYPPGIPILTCGEIITKEKIDKIKEIKKNNIKILGIEQDKINVIKS